MQGSTHVVAPSDDTTTYSGSKSWETLLAISPNTALAPVPSQRSSTRSC
jgi:hypothetical protein